MTFLFQCIDFEPTVMSWWRRNWKNCSASLRGIHPRKRPATQTLAVSYVVSMDQLLIKPSRCLWFEMPCSCDIKIMVVNFSWRDSILWSQKLLSRGMPCVCVVIIVSGWVPTSMNISILYKVVPFLPRNLLEIVMISNYLSGGDRGYRLRYGNLRCRYWRQSWHYDDSGVSVTV